MQKVILVGRHTNLGFEPSEEGIEIVETRSILWGKREKGDLLSVFVAIAQFRELLTECKEKQLGILLQSFPNVLVPALPQAFRFPVPIGIILAEMSERLADVTKVFGQFPDGFAAEECANAVQFANGRAKVVVSDYQVSVTVDPIPQFVFAGIEWMQ